MSIKIEGGGSKENVFSDSESGMPLWNGAPLLNLFYPVGSIYWSSNNTNPGTLFGGTWTQIKDKFILAAGDSYSNGATGGAATVTLTVSNMPSHSHSFTPSGTVGSHTHTGPSHTHSFTPSGNVSSHTHSFTPSGTVSSHHHTGPSHYHSFTPSGTVDTGGSWMFDIRNTSYNNSSVANIWGREGIIESDGGQDKSAPFSLATAHSWTDHRVTHPGHSHGFSGTAGNTGEAGTGNTGETSPSFTGTAGYTGETAPSFSGTAGNTGAAGTGNTGATAPSFTGTAGNTGANGSGSSFSILPPYVVKYCWERTA